MDSLSGAMNANIPHTIKIMLPIRIMLFFILAYTPNGNTPYHKKGILTQYHLYYITTKCAQKSIEIEKKAQYSFLLSKIQSIFRTIPKARRAQKKRRRRGSLLFGVRF